MPFIVFSVLQFFEKFPPSFQAFLKTSTNFLFIPQKKKHYEKDGTYQVKEIVSFYNFAIYNLKVISRTFSSNYDEASYPTIKMHVCMCTHTHTHTKCLLEKQKLQKVAKHAKWKGRTKGKRDSETRSLKEKQ